MAVIPAIRSVPFFADIATGGTVQLSIAQTGTGDSTNTAVIPKSFWDQPGAIVVTSTIGATPTVTVNVLGSSDNVNFYNIPYSLVATPRTFVVSAITITTAVTTTYILQELIPWQYLKLNYSANTNVTLTATAYL